MRKLLIILLLIAVTGGHWLLLQSAAWAGMLVSNLRHDSIQNAVSQTFDGKHPCPFCRAIEHAKQSEKKSDVEIKILRFEFTASDCVVRGFGPEQIGVLLALRNERAESLSVTPLLRPPRRDIL